MENKLSTIRPKQALVKLIGDFRIHADSELIRIRSEINFSIVT